jgi:hypothetical protein
VYVRAIPDDGTRVVALVAADAEDQRPRDHVTLVLDFLEDVAWLSSRDAGRP